jgi:WD40 repeat protein
MSRFIPPFIGLFLLGCSFPQSKPLHSLVQAPNGAYAAAFSSDMSISVVSDADNGLVVWNLEWNQILFDWSLDGEGDIGNIVSLIHIAYDKSYVVSADREVFALWNLTTGEPEGLWKIDESSIRDVAVSNQGEGILVGRGNGKVLFFNPLSGRRIEFLGHQEKINSVDLSPNSYYALTGGNDYTAYLWDTRSGQIVHSFIHPSRVTYVKLDSDGRYAFTADSQKQARIWDLQTGKEVSTLNYIERQRIFSSARFSKDGKHLLTGSPSRLMTLWDVESGSIVKEWRVNPKPKTNPPSAVVYAVGFYEDNQVYSISSSGLAEIWQR